MKSLILALALVSASAFAEVKYVDINNTTVIQLHKVELKSMHLAVNYPGPTISNVCGVEIRADSWGRHNPVDKLLEAIEIKNELGVEPVVTLNGPTTIKIDLSAAINSYGTWFSIQTKDRISLKEAIENTIGKERKVILLAISCPVP